jgi:hypothetical protein
MRRNVPKRTLVLRREFVEEVRSDHLDLVCMLEFALTPGAVGVNVEVVGSGWSNRNGSGSIGIDCTPTQRLDRGWQCIPPAWVERTA